MAFIRFFILLLWALVFVVLLLFAAKNVETVTLRFYFDHAWDAPLIVVILAAFAGGALFGLVACLPSLIRQRREVATLKREIRVRDKAAAENAVREQAPAATGTPDVPTIV